MLLHPQFDDDDEILGFLLLATLPLPLCLCFHHNHHHHYCEFKKKDSKALLLLEACRVLVAAQ